MWASASGIPCYGYDFKSHPSSLRVVVVLSPSFPGLPDFSLSSWRCAWCTFQTLALICSIKEHLFRQVRRTVRFLMQQHSRPVSARYQEHGWEWRHRGLQFLYKPRSLEPNVAAGSSYGLGLNRRTSNSISDAMISFSATWWGKSPGPCNRMLLEQLSTRKVKWQFRYLGRFQLELIHWFRFKPKRQLNFQLRNS